MFVITESGGPLRLIPRLAAPNRLHPWIEDSRALGVLVYRIRVRRDAELLEIPLDHSSLGEG